MVVMLVISGRAFIKGTGIILNSFFDLTVFVINFKLIILVMKFNIIVFLRGYRFGPPFCADSSMNIGQQLPGSGKPG